MGASNGVGRSEHGRHEAMAEETACRVPDRRHRLVIAALVGAALLLGAACGTGTSSEATPDEEPVERVSEDDGGHDHDDEPVEGLLPPPVAHAQAAQACVAPGGEQTLRVEADAGDQIRYRTRFAGGAGFADGALGGTGDGTADQSGIFTATFTVAPESPEGLAVVGVFVDDADGGHRGSTHATFHVADPNAGCPEDGGTGS